MLASRAGASTSLICLQIEHRVTIHGLRRTFAVLMQEAGAPDSIIRQALGHKAKGELARCNGLTRPRVTQLMNLLELHPLILEYVRHLPMDTPARFVTERQLRRLTMLPREQQLRVAFATMPGFKLEKC